MPARYSFPRQYYHRVNDIYHNPRVSRVTTTRTSAELTPTNKRFLLQLGLRLKQTEADNDVA